MKKLFFVLLVFISNAAFAAEALTITHADLEFDSYIRVSVPAQVIEASDATLIGKTTTYIQSLRYTASKQMTLNLQFSTTEEINHFVETQLCSEVHQVTLTPIRDSGTKGSDSFASKMKAKMITVSGLSPASKEKKFIQSILCK